MLYQIKNELITEVRKCLTSLFTLDEDQYQVNIQFPSRIEFGDFSLTFPFELARLLRQSPGKTAAQFKDAFIRPDYISRIEIAGGGFVNLYLKREHIIKDMLKSLASDSLWLPYEEDTDKYIVEHTNINPNKAAHIGHLRNAVLGDSLVRLMRFNGKQVEVQNYIDNTGVQVADVVVGFLYIEKMDFDQIKNIPSPFDYICWDLYARVSDFYARSEENQKLRDHVLQAIERNDAQISSVADYVSTRIVNCHLDTMERLGITYDLLPRESDILELKFWDVAFEQLQKTGVITYETEGVNQGCWILKYDRDDKEDTKIIVRSNGTVTYTGKDIAYQLWKLGKLNRDFWYEPFRYLSDGHVVWMTSSEPGSFGELSPPSFGNGDRIYNVIDVRQAYTQNVVYEGVRRLGYSRAAENSIHFSYEMVALSPRCAQEMGFELTEEEKQKAHVEVSGRRGLGVKADDFLDLLEKNALTEVRNRNPEMDPEKQSAIAHDIAVGALRYFMVKFTRNSLIVFDFEDALSFEGETGPYLQYSVVRARNILLKYQERYNMTIEKLMTVWQRFTEDELGDFPDDVWDLVSTLLRFREMSRSSLMSMEISSLARNLFSVSQKFSYFYNTHQIIGEKNSVYRNIFLAVVVIYHRVMTKGLEILGIPIPERM